MSKRKAFNHLLPGTPEYERRVAAGNLQVLENTLKVREEWLERASNLIPLTGSDGIKKAHKIQQDIDLLREEVRFNEQRLRDNQRQQGDLA